MRFLISLGLLVLAGDPAETPWEALERSFWVHASLATLPQRGYWGWDFPACPPPSRQAVRHAVRLLAGEYAANRLYLLYHKEMPLEEAEAVFLWWRECCPEGTEIVPTVVLRMYDAPRGEVFTVEELRQLCGFFKTKINRERVAIYDVHPHREQGKGLPLLQEGYPQGLLRVGLQPVEGLEAPYRGAVQDTWSALCHGKTHDDWQSPGFGAETLKAWVQERNDSPYPIAWNLVTVAWDYSGTPRGEYPGYDDADRNMPLPDGRNLLAFRLITATAHRERLAGFSSDLFILQVNSASPKHDGISHSFYETLKRGQRYRGYYARPFWEIVSLYRSLRAGKGGLAR